MSDKDTLLWLAEKGAASTLFMEPGQSDYPSHTPKAVLPSLPESALWEDGQEAVFQNLRPTTKVPESLLCIGVCMPPTDRATPPLRHVDENACERSVAPRQNTPVQQIWRGIRQAADVADCDIVQYSLPLWNGRSLEPFFAPSRIDGLIMMTAPNDDRPGQVASSGIPVVLVGSFGEIPVDCGAVFALESDTANLALSHLWNLGHRRIAHIAGPVADTSAGVSAPGRQEFASQVAKERLDRYACWMFLRRQYDPALVLYAGAWIAGLEFVRAFFRQWKRMANAPTAVFCASDSLAVDLLDATRAENVRVPERLSIVGDDNIKPGLRTSPPLTTVSLPAEDIGRAALKRLLQMIDQAAYDPKVLHTKQTPIGYPVTTLIRRASTGPISLPGLV